MTRNSDLTTLIAEPGFPARHIATRADDLAPMLQAIGASSIDALIAETIPDSIRQEQPLAIGPALSEPEALQKMRAVAARNKPLISMIGQGYYGAFLPSVIQRNVLESPAWYTAYTP
jgi:glycine dehydrogenase